MFVGLGDEECMCLIVVHVLSDLIILVIVGCNGESPNVASDLMSLLIADVIFQGIGKLLGSWRGRYQRVQNLCQYRSGPW